MRTQTVVVFLILLIARSPAVLAAPPAGRAFIELGGLLTMSATGDPDTQAAIALAVADIQTFLLQRGGGRRFYPEPRIAVAGTGLDPDAAARGIALLDARGLNVVIGPESSAEVQAIKPFTDARRMTLLSHCSTAPSLAIANDSVYRMVPSDLSQAKAIAALIKGNGAAAVVPMWRAGIWGDDISSAAMRQFAALGGTAFPGVRFDPEASDFTAGLLAVNRQVAEARAVFGNRVAVAFFSFGSEGAAVLAQAAAIRDLDTVTWYGSDGTALSREILNDRRAAEFAVRTRFVNTLFGDVHTPQADAVRARISAAIGGGGVHFCAMAAYDAVWLATLAAIRAGTTDADAFAPALVVTASQFEGVTGPTSLDAAGDRAQAVYDAWAIGVESGQFVWKPVAAVEMRPNGTATIR